MLLSRFFILPFSLVIWLLGCLTLLLGSHVIAAEISVTDLDGKPLSDAVVEVYINDQEISSPNRRRVVQRDATFHPHVTIMPVGSQVVFPNEDTTRHHVFSFSQAKTFDLELYLSETPEPVHFDTPGVVVLGCNIHDHMQAFIVVSTAPYIGLTNAQGRLQLTDLPEGQHSVRVWHGRMDDSHAVWWEGNVSDAERLNVRVALNALPPEPPSLSPLQKRFQEANRAQ